MANRAEAAGWNASGTGVMAGAAADATGKAAGAAACIVCHASPMAAAWAAPCGHLACWPCWQQALQARHACPQCAKPMQRHQLRQKPFA